MEIDRPDKQTHREEASVTILMATCNGERYLPEQLDSIQAQTFSNWQLWVSDDASADATLAVLADYQQRWAADRMIVLKNEKGASKGFPGNFMSLLCNPDIDADYVACSDQDDIWEPDKLSRALRWLEPVSADTPAVYFSRTRIVDSEDRQTGLSPLFDVRPCFRHALVQSIGGANTMVMNRAARRLLMLAPESQPVVSHDWWTYLVVSGCGGQVFYDSEPSVRYRQHGANYVGANTSLSARATRFLWLLQGVFRRWNQQNIDALSEIRPQLTEENRKVLDLFIAARQAGGVQGWRLLKAAGVYRASHWDRSFLKVAAMCRLL